MRQMTVKAPIYSISRLRFGTDGKGIILHRSEEILQAYLMMVLPEKCIYELRPDILDDIRCNPGGTSDKD